MYKSSERSYWTAFDMTVVMMNGDFLESSKLWGQTEVEVQIEKIDKKKRDRERVIEDGS